MIICTKIIYLFLLSFSFFFFFLQKNEVFPFFKKQKSEANYG